MSYTLNNINVTYTPGNIIFFAGISAPNGWLLCDGSSYNTTTYSQLFNIIGYLYGGSGSTFNVPNMGNNFIYGSSDTYPISNVNIGSNYATLTLDNIPAHSHTYKDAFFANNSGVIGNVKGSGDSNTNNVLVYRKIDNTTTTEKNNINTQLNTGSTGSSTPFSIIPESTVLNYIIKI